jgi:hypothetical protein
LAVGAGRAVDAVAGVLVDAASGAGEVAVDDAGEDQECNPDEDEAAAAHAAARMVVGVSTECAGRRIRRPSNA